MSTLRVQIAIDGQSRTFEGEGDGPVVVAAFRAWLAGSDMAVPAAMGADEVDRIAAVTLAAAETIRASNEREALMAEALGVGVTS